jgi:FixJ family two-component response regulator
MGADNRVIAVVPSFQEFQRICEALASDDVRVEHASCLLGAVLAHASAQMAALAEATGATAEVRAKILQQGPVVLYDADSFPQSSEDWRSAFEQLLSLHPGARVIFVSRLADEDMWIEILETGGHDLFSKPFSGTELRQAVRRALLSSSKRLATAA